MNADDARHVVEAMSAETATKSEISALNDDELLAFWLKASQEFDRLAWGSSENFRLRGYLVARRVTWSRGELDHRHGDQTSSTSPTADE